MDGYARCKAGREGLVGPPRIVDMCALFCAPGAVIQNRWATHETTSIVGLVLPARRSALGTSSDPQLGVGAIRHAARAEATSAAAVQERASDAGHRPGPWGAEGPVRLSVASNNGVLVLAAPIIDDGGSTHVELQETAQLLALLDLRPRVLYLNLQMFSEQSLDGQIGPLTDDLAVEGPLKALRAIAAVHVGQHHVLEAGVVIEGLLHLLQVRSTWWEKVRTGRQEVSALVDEFLAAAAITEHEHAAALDRWLRVDLPSLLLQDEDWLRCATDATRKIRVRALVENVQGRGGDDPRRLASWAATANALATAGRPEVVARRGLELEARVDDLAATLSIDPESVAATTKNERVRMARRLLDAEDPLVSMTHLAPKLANFARQRCQPCSATSLF